MHCDDKRTLFALRENIERAWQRVRESDFEDGELLGELLSSIAEYADFKHPQDPGPGAGSAD